MSEALADQDPHVLGTNPPWPEDRGLRFADLIAPLSEETFFAEYYGKKPLHLKGAAANGARVMDFGGLNALLGLSSVWTNRSLHLVLDKKPVPKEDYCREVPGLGGRVVQADPGKVRAWLAKGASAVLNNIDTLSAPLQAVAEALEQGVWGHCQANLYCSFKEHQAFDSHFDTHEVFALHTEGTKTWRIYSGRIDNPVSHPMFTEQPGSFHMKARGEVLFEAHMEPGDLLYIPRGQYHDALASSEACIHVAFGVIPLRGLDLLHLMEEACTADPLFRADLPPAKDEAGRKALAQHLGTLAERLGMLMREPQILAELIAAQKTQRGLRGGFTLPERPASQGYRVTAKGLRVAQKGHDYILKDDRQGVPLPPGTNTFVGWVLSKDAFTRDQAAAEFRQYTDKEIDTLLGQLEAMKVITKA